MSSEAFYVWDASSEQLSSNYDELLTTFRKALENDDVPPTEKLLAFARSLPDRVSDKKDVDEEVVYFFGQIEKCALANRYGALRLELPADPFWVVKRVLVQVAAEVGLVIFDDLQGMFFLPDGRIWVRSGMGRCAFWITRMNFQRRCRSSRSWQCQ